MSSSGSTVLKTLTRLALIAVAIIIPACGKTDKKTPPQLVDVFPVASTNAPRFPNIFLRFDKALDPSSVQSSVQLIDQSNSVQSILVTYNPGLFEIRIVPQSLPLGMNATPSGTTVAYQVNIFPGLMGADGSTLEQGLFYQFNVPANDDASRPSFAGITSVTPGTTTSSELTLNWAAATDSNFMEYHVFKATSPGTQDLATGTPIIVSGIATTSTVITGLNPSTTYYFVIKAVDNAGNLDAQFMEMSGTTTP